LPELGTWRGEITLRPGTSYAVRGVLPKPDAPAAPTPPPSTHHASHVGESVANHAPGAGGAQGHSTPTGASGAAGTMVVAGASGGGGDTGAAVERPYRPPPDSGILFLDLQGGAPRAP
jgi:hypothetical protein